MRSRSFTIGRLAGSAGVNVETVRYYQRRGLMAVPVAEHGRMRRYADDSLRRLRFIKRAQQLGFTLEEIGQLLKLSEMRGCSSICAVGERRLADIEKKIADLMAMQRSLQHLVGACRTNPQEAPCPLVESIGQ